MNKLTMEINKINKQDNYNVELYFGKLKPYGGKIKLTDDKYQDIQNKISRMYKKYKIFNNTVYYFRDMIMEINENNTLYYQQNILDYSIDKHFCLIKYRKKYITNNQFPIINKYHDIKVQKIKSYRVNDIYLLFIEEGNNKYVKIEFNSNKFCINTALKISNIIIKSISNLGLIF